MVFFFYFQATHFPEEDSCGGGALQPLRQAHQVRQVGAQVSRLRRRLPHRVQARRPHAVRRKCRKNA